MKKARADSWVGSKHACMLMRVGVACSRMLCRPFLWKLLFGDLKKQSQRPVYRRRIREDLGHVGIEQGHVRSGLVRGVMFAADAARTFVLWPKFVRFLILDDPDSAFAFSVRHDQ